MLALLATNKEYRNKRIQEYRNKTEKFDCCLTYNSLEVLSPSKLLVNIIFLKYFKYCQSF